MSNLFECILHNVGVVFVGFAVAWLGTIIDSLLAFSTFASLPAKWVGALLLALGFLLRVWATVHFYSHRMRVISLKPQSTLITLGPYRFSRNPIYLGGNVFIFFGAALFFGSPTAQSWLAGGIIPGAERLHPCRQSQGKVCAGPRVSTDSHPAGEAPS